MAHIQEPRFKKRGGKGGPSGGKGEERERLRERKSERRRSGVAAARRGFAALTSLRVLKRATQFATELIASLMSPEKVLPPKPARPALFSHVAREGPRWSGTPCNLSAAFWPFGASLLSPALWLLLPRPPALLAWLSFPDPCSSFSPGCYLRSGLVSQGHASVRVCVVCVCMCSKGD